MQLCISGRVVSHSRTVSLDLNRFKPGPRPRAQCPSRRVAQVARAVSEARPVSEVTRAEQERVAKMVNLAVEYFNSFYSNCDMEAAERILDKHVVHRDMVRNECKEGIFEYQQFVQDLKRTYPGLYVKPTKFGVASDNSLFCAFEGRAAPDTELFQGVDYLVFNDSATSILEVQVFRANYLGAAGHSQRKQAAQAQARA